MAEIPISREYDQCEYIPSPFLQGICYERARQNMKYVTYYNKLNQYRNSMVPGLKFVSQHSCRYFPIELSKELEILHNLKIECIDREGLSEVHVRKKKSE